MKKIIMLFFVLVMSLMLALSVSAVTEEYEGYYTYTVTDGKATIKDVSPYISGDIVIPNTLGGYTVTGIGVAAFRDCKELISITIAGDITTIGDYAFDRCFKLRSITIGKNVTSIGKYALPYGDNLKSITVDKYNTKYSSDFEGVLFNKNKTQLIQYPIGNHNEFYVIPDSVTTIKEMAFYGVFALTSIEIPDSVTKIERFAFGECTNLTSVTIPDGVTAVAEGVFSDCYNLTSVTIGNAVTTIEKNAFSDCSNLVSVKIPESVTKIGDQAFFCCMSLTDVYYKGTMAQWKNIDMGTYNGDLKSANIYYHYNNHSYNEVITPYTCTDLGYTTYICVCGETYVDNYRYPSGHNFNGSICTECSYDRIDDCKCNCHKTGLMSIIWNIINFFNKLLRKNPTCTCGVAHY